MKPMDIDDANFWEKWKKPMAGLVAAVVLIYFFFPTGLFGKSDRVRVVPAQGKLDFEGNPIPQASIFLHPIGVKDPAFPRPRAIVQADGTFVLGTYKKDDGAPPGDYQVTVHWFQRIVKTKGEEDDSMPINLLPAKYGNAATSALTLTIQEGENQGLTLKLKH